MNLEHRCRVSDTSSPIQWEGIIYLVSLSCLFVLACPETGWSFGIAATVQRNSGGRFNHLFTENLFEEQKSETSTS
jgi:hypothetical protein